MKKIGLEFSCRNLTTVRRVVVIKILRERNQLVKDAKRGVLVINATFNNISGISWQSVLLIEETGVPEQNHRPATNFIT
jgi:hypothetical protein